MSCVQENTGFSISLLCIDGIMVTVKKEVTSNSVSIEVRPSMKSITDGEKPVEVTYTEVSEEKIPIKIKVKYF